MIGEKNIKKAAMEEGRYCTKRKGKGSRRMKNATLKRREKGIKKAGEGNRRDVGQQMTHQNLLCFLETVLLTVWCGLMGQGI